MMLPTRQNGFTLLEALVALVVISIGLLGLLGLQTVAIVNTHVSRSQTLASIGADDIVDRMRANPAADTSTVYAAIDGSSGSKPSPDCTQIACAPAEMAHFDAWEWQQTLSETLPAGHGTVTCARPSAPSAANPCQIYDVTVLWRGRNNAAGSGSADATHCPKNGSNNDSSVRCYSIEVQP